MSKVAIITGATGNLGQAVTKKMVESGYTVVGTVEPGKDDQTRQEGATFKSVDLLDPTAARTFVMDVESSLGRIDVAICLVGGFSMASVVEATADKIQKMINLNFYTAFNLVQPIMEITQDQSEQVKIILVGAKPAFEPKAARQVFPYALSKSMVVKMAGAINADSENLNATATIVVPSIIDTPVNREAMPDADFSDWVTPASIAEKISFLCSEKGGDLRETVLKIYGNS